MAATPGKGSRNKGAAGEREVAEIFRKRGYNAQRTPNSGGLWIKGDLEGLPGIHAEIKRAERANFTAWYKQAKRDRPPGKMAVVIHRANRGEWVVYCSLDNFLQLYEQVAKKNLDTEEARD